MHMNVKEYLLTDCSNPSRWKIYSINYSTGLNVKSRYFEMKYDIISKKSLWRLLNLTDHITN